MNSVLPAFFLISARTSWFSVEVADGLAVVADAVQVAAAVFGDSTVGYGYLSLEAV